jgi:hypothetical protein
MDILFIGVLITWEGGFDTEDGIPMVRFAFIEGTKGDGRGDFMPSWWWMEGWVY